MAITLNTQLLDNHSFKEDGGKTNEKGVLRKSNWSDHNVLRSQLSRFNTITIGITRIGHNQHS